MRRSRRRLRASNAIAKTQIDEARATLTRGLKIADAKLGRPGSPQWNDQIAAQMLMREARALIENGSQTSGEAK